MPIYKGLSFFILFQSTKFNCNLITLNNYYLFDNENIMSTNRIINITFFTTLIAVVGIMSYKQGKVIRKELKEVWDI
jgi:uncharacterized protein (DUF1015 family)